MAFDNGHSFFPFRSSPLSMFLLRFFVVSLLTCSIDSAFILPTTNRKQQSVFRHNAVSKKSLPSPEESAKALTDYMAKAHEEKVKAMAAVEAKYQDRIRELETKVKQLEGRSPVQTSTNSYEFPATNKKMSERVKQYQTFLSNYLVNAQKEKVQAVAAAEAKLKSHYEAIIEDLKSKQSSGDALFAASPSTTESADAELTGKGGFQ